jgi:threonine/homoserine/homoserine lactone efflux protein
VSSLYLAYLAATVVLVITPGATTAVVVRNTLANGHSAGVRAALGAMVANTTHATLAGLGLWVLVGRWPTVLDALRVGGAAYLAWLGLNSLARVWPAAKRHGAPFSVESAPAARRTPDAPASGFVEGLTVNLLNPAIISFYIAVVPTFIPPAPPRFYFALLAATHIVLGFACHAGWATAFHALRRVFARPGVRMTFELGTAAAMLWLSARVLGRM